MTKKQRDLFERLVASGMTREEAEEIVLFEPDKIIVPTPPDRPAETEREHLSTIG